MSRSPQFLLAALLLVVAPLGAQSQLTIVAEDSKCIASVSHQNWNDNRFRAYWNNGGQGFVDGLVRFDLSGLAPGTNITGLTLRAYHEQGFGNPVGNPMVNCYRVADDSWMRGATDNHPGLNEQLTPQPQGGFPTGNLVPVDFVLDVNAANWAADIADGKLSLALRNENGAQGIYSYVYFHGSDPAGASNQPPELIVDYASGPSLNISGPCPGQATLTGIALTPNGTVFVGYTFQPGGSWAIPGGSCAGAVLPTASRPHLLLSTQADPGGDINLQVNVPPAACGNVSVLLFDLASCTPSNLFPL